MCSIYDALGGLPALEVAIARFCERVAGDPEVAPFFIGMDLHRQKSHLIAYVAQAIGGPARYSGASMRAAHRRVRIDQRHFDAVARHLADTLRELGIGDPLVEAVMRRIR